MSRAEITEIGSPFTVYETPWGSYYVNRNNKPMRCFFKDGQELILENFNVIIHDNGIEFLDEDKTPDLNKKPS